MGGNPPIGGPKQCLWFWTDCLRLAEQLSVCALYGKLDDYQTRTVSVLCIDMTDPRECAQVWHFVELGTCRAYLQLIHTCATRDESLWYPSDKPCVCVPCHRLSYPLVDLMQVIEGAALHLRVWTPAQYPVNMAQHNVILINLCFPVLVRHSVKCKRRWWAAHIKWCTSFELPTDWIGHYKSTDHSDRGHAIYLHGLSQCLTESNP